MNSEKVESKSLDDTMKIYEKIAHKPLDDEGLFIENNFAQNSSAEISAFSDTPENPELFEIRNEFERLCRQKDKFISNLLMYLSEGIEDYHISVCNNIKIYTNIIYPSLFSLMEKLGCLWYINGETDPKNGDLNVCIVIEMEEKDENNNE